METTSNAPLAFHGLDLSIPQLFQRKTKEKKKKGEAEKDVKVRGGRREKSYLGQCVGPTK